MNTITVKTEVLMKLIGMAGTNLDWDDLQCGTVPPRWPRPNVDLATIAASSGDPVPPAPVLADIFSLVEDQTLKQQLAVATVKYLNRFIDDCGTPPHHKPHTPQAAVDRICRASAAYTSALMIKDDRMREQMIKVCCRSFEDGIKELEGQAAKK